MITVLNFVEPKAGQSHIDRAPRLAAELPSVHAEKIEIEQILPKLVKS